MRWRDVRVGRRVKIRPRSAVGALVGLEGTITGLVPNQSGLVLVGFNDMETVRSAVWPSWFESIVAEGGVRYDIYSLEWLRGEGGGVDRLGGSEKPEGSEAE